MHEVLHDDSYNRRQHHGDKTVRDEYPWRTAPSKKKERKLPRKEGVSYAWRLISSTVFDLMIRGRNEVQAPRKTTIEGSWDKKIPELWPLARLSILI
jgi:hypothetical protein